MGLPVGRTNEKRKKDCGGIMSLVVKRLCRSISLSILKTAIIDPYSLQTPLMHDSKFDDEFCV